MRFVTAGILASFVVLLSGCNSAPPPGVASMVNNKPITFAEVDRQYHALFGSAPKGGDDQVTLQKLEVLRGLIDNEIMLQRAEKLSLLATDSDVDTKYNELKAPYTQEELTRQLKERNLTQEELICLLGLAAGVLFYIGLLGWVIQVVGVVVRGAVRRGFLVAGVSRN